MNDGITVTLESPKIENQHVVDEINGVVGGNVTLKCKTSGHPRPETTWFHNGRILNRYKRSEPVEKSDNRSEEYVALELTNVKNNDAGVYTLLAFNSAGVVEKKFKIKILGLSVKWVCHFSRRALVRG